MYLYKPNQLQDKQGLDDHLVISKTMKNIFTIENIFPKIKQLKIICYVTHDNKLIWVRRTILRIYTEVKTLILMTSKTTKKNKFLLYLI